MNIKDSWLFLVLGRTFWVGTFMLMETADKQVTLI